MVTPSESPWARGQLRIARAALAVVEDDARARYLADEEACGYLAGPAIPGDLCDQAVVLPNLANKLHALDPEASLSRKDDRWSRDDLVTQARLYDEEWARQGAVRLEARRDPEDLAAEVAEAVWRALRRSE